MVNNIALGALCIECGLDAFIIHDSSSLQKSINAYRTDARKAQKLEYDLAEAEGRMPGQYWVDLEPPKVCSSQYCENLCPTPFFRFSAT